MARLAESAKQPARLEGLGKELEEEESLTEVTVTQTSAEEDFDLFPRGTKRGSEDDIDSVIKIDGTFETAPHSNLPEETSGGNSLFDLLSFGKPRKKARTPPRPALDHNIPKREELLQRIAKLAQVPASDVFAKLHAASDDELKQIYDYHFEKHMKNLFHQG